MLVENLLMALKAIWANKMRSMLTTLGIVIGTAAVIAVVSIVQGFSQVITNEVQNLGSNTLVVRPQRPPGKEGEALGKIVLTWDDGQALMRVCPSVSIVTPILQNFGPVKFEDQTSDYPIAGVQPVFQDVRNYYVETGRFFSALDDSGRAHVAVIGHGVLKDLKLPDNPLGRDLLIRGRAYTIVGVMESKGQILGQDLDKFVIIPYGTAAALEGTAGQESVRLLVRSTTPDTVDAAQLEIENALRVRHRLRPEQPNDFEVETQKELLKTFSKFANGVTYVVAGVVSIALLVGGIGIMNIMLVSVTERTREIGIRMAIGARGADVMLQFLVESIVMCLLGGLLGLAVGVGGATLVGHLTGWSIDTPVSAVFLAIGFSAAVGIFFGFYPARKAASLDPIQALRFE